MTVGVAGDDDADRLRRHGDGEEHQGEADERRRARTLGGLVDDRAHDQRAGEGQRRAGGQERAEDGPTTSVGPQQGDEGAPARRRCVGTRGVSRPRGRDSGGSAHDPLTTVVCHAARARYALLMEQDTATLEAPESTDDLVEEELLVEEISIDGMCGVY